MAHRRSTSRFTPYRINPKDYAVEDFFSDEEMFDLVLTVRQRIIGAFHHATEIRDGRKRGTDNYILGVQPRVSELARYVLGWMKDPFIRPSQLDGALDVRAVPTGDLNRLIYQLQYEIIMSVLNVMVVKPPKTPPGFIPKSCSDEIWYDSVRCYWQIRQSSIDQYIWFRKNFRQRLKRDDRNYHGRNRGQSRARGIPGGTSIGLG